jgi:hypothetical protein
MEMKKRPDPMAHAVAPEELWRVIALARQPFLDIHPGERAFYYRGWEHWTRVRVCDDEAIYALGPWSGWALKACHLGWTGYPPQEPDLIHRRRGAV